MQIRQPPRLMHSWSIQHKECSTWILPVQSSIFRLAILEPYTILAFDFT